MKLNAEIQKKKFDTQFCDSSIFDHDQLPDILSFFAKVYDEVYEDAWKSCKNCRVTGD